MNNNLEFKILPDLKKTTEETVQLFEEIESNVHNPDIWRLKAFKEIIAKLANNNNRFKYTHKEVIAYAKSLNLCIEDISLWSNRDEISLLLLAISKHGLNHYERSFLAAQIYELIEESERDEHEWKKFKREFGDVF